MDLNFSPNNINSVLVQLDPTEYYNIIISHIFYFTIICGLWSLIFLSQPPII